MLQGKQSTVSRRRRAPSHATEQAKHHAAIALSAAATVHGSLALDGQRLHLVSLPLCKMPFRSGAPFFVVSARQHSSQRSAISFEREHIAGHCEIFNI